MSKIVKPVNKPRSKGISIIAKGIKILKFSSKVNELAIQDMPLKYKLKPKKIPNINKFFLWGFFLKVLLDFLLI